MQAIQTKYLGPTRYKPSRIVATCSAGRLIASKDSLDNAAENGEIDCTGLPQYEQAHYVCAVKLATKFGWIGKPYEKLIGGGLKDGSNVWVFTGTYLQTTED